MAFTGHENHDISLQTASEWTKNFRDSINPGETIAHFFSKDAIQAILNQSECVGMRIYYALDDQNAKHLILVGANASENDLYQGLLAERSFFCPQSCSIANPLNSD